MLIPLRRRDGTVRAHALIDDSAAHLAEHRWCLHSKGYAYRMVARKAVLLHRVVLGLTSGDGLEGDHENGDRLDCRRLNLRGKPAERAGTEWNVRLSGRELEQAVGQVGGERCAQRYEAPHTFANEARA